jgi:glycosyltransferase involved in cell wall biosynthesis
VRVEVSWHDDRDARPPTIYSTIDCKLVRRPSVTIILNSGAHQRTLPDALLREGLLRAAVRTATDLDILKPGPDGGLKLVRRFPTYRIGNRILWAIWRRAPPRWRKFVPLLGWSTVSDHWISGRLPASDVFHSPMGVYFESLRRAKARGAVTLIDTPTMHPLAFQREVLNDYLDAGVSAFDGEHLMSPAVISRCQRQYEMCDRIIVYSSAARRSFDPFSYAGKTVVVMPGVDHHLFRPPAGVRRSGSFRVCYVGRIEAPKGIHHLLGAWKQLSLPGAELTLVGRVLPEMAYLETEGGAGGIRLAGILPAEGVARCCQESDLFVFPSVNEGLSLALLEGMSCGLPVVACRDSGAEDCVTPGKEGLLVPGRDPAALAEAILWCYRHRDELAAMGRAARLRVEAEFTLAHYWRRLVELYQSEQARRPVPPNT